MSRISNERIKVLTLNESQKYSKLYSKESQKIKKYTAENFNNSYKTSMK